MRPLQAFGPALGIAVLATPMVAAQPFNIDSFTVDGGGGMLVGTNYTLSGTIGQPDAGVLDGSSFSISGGFWMAVGVPGCNLADLAEPFGVLDLGDINVFVSGFVIQDPIADLNDDTILDLADINLFISLFIAGCP